MPLNIAMDGPVGAGKSTIADEVARRLGILHLDTGAMYRALGLSCLRNGIDTADENAVTAKCQSAVFTVTYGADGQHTLVDGVDVTGYIRTPEVSMAASTVGKYAGVRKAMVAAQQAIAATTDILVDGRDICLRVLPDAQVKIYLTASAEERARRRWEQMKEKGDEHPYEQVLEELKQRDAQDMNRAVDPLRPTPDAVIVDTTTLDFEQTVSAILRLVEEKSHD